MGFCFSDLILSNALHIAVIQMHARTHVHMHAHTHPVNFFIQLITSFRPIWHHLFQGASAVAMSADKSCRRKIYYSEPLGSETDREGRVCQFCFTEVFMDSRRCGGGLGGGGRQHCRIKREKMNGREENSV